MAWIPFILVVLATFCDLRKREVPDAIPLALLAWAMIATGFGWNDVGWGSLVGGFAIGLALSVVFFAVGGLGGGDVKMLAALGASLGHAAVFPALFWIAIAGGVLSLVALIRGRRDLAYLPAIALGLLLFQLCKDSVSHASPR